MKVVVFLLVASIVATDSGTVERRQVVCPELCQDDTDCAPGLLCLPNGCGQSCRKNTLFPLLNPGTVLRRQVVGVCAELCQDDSDCGSGLQCRSNGCGHSCQTADIMPGVSVDCLMSVLHCLCPVRRAADDDDCPLQCPCRNGIRGGA